MGQKDKVIEFLPVEFVMGEVERNPKPLNELGEFTYMRTYSRWLESRGRRERWHETVKRAIEYNMSLEYKHMLDIGLKPDKVRLKEEAKEIFKNIYSAKQQMSGRTLWIGNGNVKINENYPLGNFNCSFSNMETWDDLAETMYLLSLGVGVGLKSTPEMARSMGKIRANFELINMEYEPLPKEQRKEGKESHVEIEPKSAYIEVFDSKEGWSTATREFFKILTDRKLKDVEVIKINYNNVRPKGERLKTFGGTASGAEPLMELFQGIHDVLNNKVDPYLEPITLDEDGFGYVRPIHILDIANMIGNTIVVGGKLSHASDVNKHSFNSVKLSA